MSLKKQQRLIQVTSDKKQHVKLYKAGKVWLSMGITFAVLGLAGCSTTTLAKADVTAATGSTSVTQTSAVTSDKAPNSQQPKGTLTPAQTTTPAAATNSASTTKTIPQINNADLQSASSLTTPTDTTNLGSASSSEVEAAKKAGCATLCCYGS